MDSKDASATPNNSKRRPQQVAVAVVAVLDNKVASARTKQQSSRGFSRPRSSKRTSRSSKRRATTRSEQQQARGARYQC